jgi:hypothetical protein
MIPYEKLITDEAKISPEDKFEEINGIYTISYGTIIIDNKPIDSVKLINIDYKPNFIFDGNIYDDSSKIHSDFSSFLKNGEFEKAVGLKHIVNEKYIQILDSFAREIAQKNSSFSLLNHHRFAPYRNLLLNKSLF